MVARHRQRLWRAALAGAVAVGALSLGACKREAEQPVSSGSGSAVSPTDGASASAPGDEDVAGGAGPGRAHETHGGAGAGGDDGTDDDAGDSGDPGSETPGPGGDDGLDTSYAVDPPGPFTGLSRADVLITATGSLPDSLVTRIAKFPGVADALALSVGSASIDGRTLTVAAVDPGEFRRFTPDVTARADFVWDRVAAGEVALDSDVSKRLVDRHDMIKLGSDQESPVVHVGAFAPLVRRSPNTPAERPVIQAVMNARRGEQLGIVEQNALLIDTGQFTPSALAKPLERILGDRATMETLALEFADFGQTAVLTGQSVTDAVGTFTYTNGPDGTIVPDQGWVQEYIRTEQVPILGAVTCNKGLLPQLRGALTQIRLEGLADKIHPDEYAGCYYPRYIGRDPANGLSLHSWGIAVDLNTPGNQRGTAGEMDPRVVQIFKDWGFAWGGDWNYTDPMHFEMSKVVRPDSG